MSYAIVVAEVGGPTVAAGVATWFAARWRRRVRYLRTLANISLLERQLGIDREPFGMEKIAMQLTEVQRSTYTQSPLPPSGGYQGPPMTDADVRRVEHPQEFS